MTTTTPTSKPTDNLPTAGTWRIDPGHADVAFVGRHFGLTRIRGRFTGVTGTVVVADDLAASTIDVEIDMRSVESGDDTRDTHLRSSDLFDVDTYPVASFRSTAVEVDPRDGAHGRVVGDLTIKGTTRAVTLDVELLGELEDPWGGTRAVFSASTTIDRTDWGVSWNVVLDAGGLLVSKQIRLEIDVELVKQQ